MHGAPIVGRSCLLYLRVDWVNRWAGPSAIICVRNLQGRPFFRSSWKLYCDATEGDVKVGPSGQRRPIEMAETGRSSVMDAFVSRLRTNNRLISRDENFTKTVLKSRSPIAPTSEAERTVSKECDQVVRWFMGRSNWSGAVDSLGQYARKKKFPSCNTLMVLASGCALVGDLDGVRAVCAGSFSEELGRQIGYRHYEAEAIWRGPSRNHRDALLLFAELFERHPSKRRKVTNMSAFCLRDVINSGRSELYPDALAFVTACYRVDGTGVPAANLWRTAFCSDSFEAQCLSDSLLNRSEGGAVFRRCIAEKIPGVVREARRDMRVDTLQRLMELALRLDLEQHATQVIEAYIEYLCEVDDVRGACEAFRYVRRSSTYICTETAEKLMALLVRHTRLVLPPTLSDMKRNLNAQGGRFKF